MNSMNGLPNITLFAPSNAAWEVPEVKRILTDSKRVEDILNLHLVREPLPLELIKQKSGRLVSNFFSNIYHTNLYYFCTYTIKRFKTNFINFKV